MTDTLCFQARAVYDAFNRIGLYNEPSFETDRKALAAALRAAATYLPNSAMYPSCDWGYGWRNGIGDAEQKLLAIANELEGANA